MRRPLARMMTVALLVTIALGCDVEASLGAHDADIDGALSTCSPPDAGACAACQATSCCAAFAACTMLPTCGCIVDCTLSGHAVDGCVTHCGGAVHDMHTALITCAENHCAAACP